MIVVQIGGAPSFVASPIFIGTAVIEESLLSSLDDTSLFTVARSVVALAVVGVATSLRFGKSCCEESGEGDDGAGCLLKVVS